MLALFPLLLVWLGIPSFHTSGSKLSSVGFNLFSTDSSLLQPHYPASTTATHFSFPWNSYYTHLIFTHFFTSFWKHCAIFLSSRLHQFFSSNLCPPWGSVLSFAFQSNQPDFSMYFQNVSNNETSFRVKCDYRAEH